MLQPRSVIPHIVPVYFVGVERGVHYFAMQLIEGCSLAYVIDQLRRAQADGEPVDSPRLSPSFAGARPCERHSLPAMSHSYW